MATVAQLNGYVDAAIAAMDSGDWVTAESKLLLAKAVLVGLPDTVGKSTELSWDRSAIDGLLVDVKQKRGAALGRGGIQRKGIKYVNPGC